MKAVGEHDMMKALDDDIMVLHNIPSTPSCHCHKWIDPSSQAVAINCPSASNAADHTVPL